MKRTENESGFISLRDGVIQCASSGDGTWSLPLSKVRAVGEYTTEDGPFADDWFLVLLTEDEAFEASFLAHGQDKFLEDLSAALGTEICGELVGSTDFKSHLLWPPHLKGQRLFEYGRKWWSIVVHSRVAPEVWEAIRTTGNNAAGDRLRQGHAGQEPAR